MPVTIREWVDKIESGTEVIVTPGDAETILAYIVRWERELKVKTEKIDNKVIIRKV